LLSKNLILTVGLPRSGKSTWAKEQGHPIVNPDAIRLAMHGTAYNTKVEPLVWATAKYMVEALFLAGHDKVIVDATNSTRKRREFWKSDDWERSYMHFGAKGMLETCLARNCDEVDTKGLEHVKTMNGVIKRMYDNWEDILDDELDDS
jgi:predicted kinase